MGWSMVFDIRTLQCQVIKEVIYLIVYSLILCFAFLYAAIAVAALIICQRHTFTVAVF